MIQHKYAASALLALPLLFAPVAAAREQPEETAAEQTEAKASDSTTRARPVTDVVTQPLVDLGIMRTDIPPALQAAWVAPYARPQGRGCASLASEIATLDSALGADFDAPPGDAGVKRANTAIGVGGRLLSGFVMPFRGVVREVTGSAEAERDLNAAVAAGIARRAFLKGLGSARRCGPTAAPASPHNEAVRIRAEEAAAKERDKQARRAAEAAEDQARADMKAAEKRARAEAKAEQARARSARQASGI